ncbi:MAG TPA: hypothetical protein VIH52_00820 [Candidatus Nanoarchaeia archaeon]|nr:hypothetical protein [uncultured archaeon]
MSLLVKHFVAEPKAIIALQTLELSSEERQKLAEAITLLYHQKLLNRFLEVLSEVDRKIFMEAFLDGTQERSFEFLHEKINNIELVVEEALKEIEEQILADFEELKGNL